MNLSPVTVGQMKRVVNASNNFVLLMIKSKDIDESKAFIGFDSNLKNQLVELVNTSENMFQEPEGLPPKRGFQHEIHL